MIIEVNLPRTWRILEKNVARILKESGFNVESPLKIDTARDNVEVDVYAVNPDAIPPAKYLFECKYWASNLPRHVVNSFRTVVSDFGANTGFIIVKNGFQPGAIQAASFSNLELLTFVEFQEMFSELWFQKYFEPTLREEVDPLLEYTEPINSRIFKKADRLTEVQRTKFKELRETYQPLAMIFTPIAYQSLMREGRPGIELPLSNRFSSYPNPMIPDALSPLIEAEALRQFLDISISFAKKAIAEFDEVFGERA